MRPAAKASLKAGDIMSRHLVTVPMSAPLEALAVILHENHISGAPVVDDSGHLCGVVSQTDLVRHDMAAGSRGHIVPITAPIESDDPELEPDEIQDAYYRHLDGSDFAELRERFVEEDYGGATVADIYTPYTITAAVDTPLATLATLMVEKGIHRVIVTDGRKVAGIVTSMDILRTMTGTRPAKTAPCLVPR